MGHTSETGNWGVYSPYPLPTGGGLLTHPLPSAKIKSPTPLRKTLRRKLTGIVLQWGSCEWTLHPETHRGTFGAWSRACPVPALADICWVMFPHAGL